ncbi:TetR family transcriptional regulator [Mycolicibacterium sp. S2-37]|uniref:TetR/AcrR family transcriptional regulator n=1 Tax=Mycolicibacterium sp. S2-37 TaxID=2810297 RepID=UPI001A94653A|nr:TetR family transcriptional regulator [Mycolicibacterium sp. S2-37]MBO0679964.1 TetR family transcriptional regulator [Mycolicibacterium sp. S2-37]
MSERNAPRRTQAERRAETTARLIDAAIGLWATRGIEDVSLDEIAAAAGRTRGAFHANFRDRSELAARVRDTIVADAAENISSAVHSAPNPSTQLSAYIRANVGYIAAKPAHARVLAAIVQHEEWTGAARYIDRARGGSSDVVVILRRGIERGDFRQLDVDLTAMVIRGALDAQIVSGRIVDMDSATTIADELVELFTSGVSSRPPRARARG